MAFCRRSRSVAKRLHDGLSIKPRRKLVGIMTASGLAALAAGNEQNGVVPVCGVGNEAHRRAVPLRCGARAETRSGLRLVWNAQEKFQPATSSDGMAQFECVEISPLPIAYVRAPRFGS